MTEPLVTVVISPREGHFMAESSLLSVLADDRIPFDLIYVDFGAPPKVTAALQRHAAERGFRLVQNADWMPPSLARKSVLPEVRTKYVAFADNDIVVEPGCLQALVACAEETGAGLISPLYVQAGGGRTPTIHMAGGIFEWSDAREPRLVGASHRGSGQPLEAAAVLRREQVDFTEYHYVLARMDLVRRSDAISEDVLLIHEHLDLALFARELGVPVLFEPSARVTYMAFEPRPLSDTAFYRRRWDVSGCDASLAAFARRWPFADSGAVIESLASYAAERLQEVSVRRLGSDGADLAAPMRRAELAQSRFDLREQAIDRGYSDDEVRGFESACDLATFLFDGIYRPDGRPFLSHVIGTASVLVRYEVRADVIQAGLLHAALTHRPDWASEVDVASALRLAGIETLVRGQPVASAFLSGDADIASLNMIGVRIIAILAANDIDMRLSGEFRATGRFAELTPTMRERIGEVLEGFGVDGLAASAKQLAGEVAAWPVLGTPVHGSFRLDAKNRRMLPV
jgi:glycosyltransferase involved in cell wall biosynthesis